MSDMFHNADQFNQDISSCDTSSASEISDMFHNAEQFNQDISNWHTSSATDM